MEAGEEAVKHVPWDSLVEFAFCYTADTYHGEVA